MYCLLDEPTNHLDIEVYNGERFLANNAKAVLLVVTFSYFVLIMSNHLLRNIVRQRLVDYKVKYDEYVTLRAERREQQLRAL